jgi:hypothetical protein
MKSDPALRIKAISAASATATSAAAFLLLRYSSWDVPQSLEALSGRVKHDERQLDDLHNPNINGRNYLANALTAYETAYLLYDTYAMVNASRRKNRLPSNGAAFRQVSQDWPVMMAHHVLLSSAFLVLQCYILRGKEKGMWIITAFMLMNSSTPLMHARWWRRRKSGKANSALDLAFLTTFAVSRFGVTFWIMRTYGQYHGLGPWQAYRMLRKRCQVGTGLLVSLNGIWWIILCVNILKRSMRKLASKETSI